jgi:hypothetical protein
MKRERAVKRERRVDDHDADEDDNDFVVPRSATAAVDVDLTEEVRAAGLGCPATSFYEGCQQLVRQMLTMPLLSPSLCQACGYIGVVVVSCWGAYWGAQAFIMAV